MRRIATNVAAGLAAALVVGVLAAPVASAQSSLNLYVGGFTPRGEDGRDSSDVLRNNLDFLVFNIKDFAGPTFGGEFLVGIGRNVEAGLGIGFQTRTVPSIYSEFVNMNGSEIEQDLKLRIVPFTATVRFLPLGSHDTIAPYIGAGIGVLNWRYSESGQFLATDRSIFRDTFIGKGSATGPVILGGVRIPVGNGGFGGEIRYQSAKGDLPKNQGFGGNISNPTIDLGGITYLFTVNFRF